MDGSLANLWAGERVISWDRSQRSISEAEMETGSSAP
jgi:hypothetical protein